LTTCRPLPNGKPARKEGAFVHGAVAGFSGQLIVIYPEDPLPRHLRRFADGPEKESKPNGKFSGDRLAAALQAGGDKILTGIVHSAIAAFPRSLNGAEIISLHTRPWQGRVSHRII
jgi:molybdopterin/thiamine biosynthesis adenylyltransferase